MDRARQDTWSGSRRPLPTLALLLTAPALGRATAGDEATDREYTQFEQFGKMGVKVLDTGDVIVPAHSRNARGWCQWQILWRSSKQAKL